MKIFNFIGIWIDKLETKIFGSEGYLPMAGKGFVQTLTVAIVVGLVLFIVQMSGKGRTAQDWVIGIGGVAMLATMVRAVLPIFMKGTGTIVAKIGYGFFCFFLTYIAVQLAMFIVFLILAIILLRIMVFFLAGSSNEKKTRGSNKCYHCDSRGLGRHVCGVNSKHEGKEVLCDSYYNPSDCPHFVGR